MVDIYLNKSMWRHKEGNDFGDVMCAYYHETYSSSLLLIF